MVNKIKVAESKKNVQIMHANASVVLVGVGFSPASYVGGDLIDKGIIHPDWNWKVTKSTSNQSASTVEFNEGRIIFALEKSKLTVIHNLFEKDEFSKSKLGDIAKSFLQLNKHLKFSSLGINFTAVVEVDEPSGYLKRNFLAEDKRVAGNYSVAQMNMNLAFVLGNQTVLTTSFVEGEVESRTPNENKQHQGVICVANFHREINAESNTSVIVDQLSQIENDRKVLEEILKSIF
jgi:hypothetical protein